jgi:hypothetical protein
MNEFVVAFQHLKSAHKAGFRHLKERKISAVFDLVVTVQLRQEELKPRHEPAPKSRRRDAALAEFAHAGLKRPTEIAKHVVALEPEPGGLAEIRVPGPDLSRVTLEKGAQACWPAGPGVEAKIVRRLHR